MKDTTGSTEAPSVLNLTAYIPSCRPYCRDPGVDSPKDAYTLLGINTKSHYGGGKNVGFQVSRYNYSFISTWKPAGVTNSSPRNAVHGVIAFLLSFMVGVISIVINEVLSHFDRANSTNAQRTWTMTWLCFGCFLGPIYSMTYGEVPFFSTTDPELKRNKGLKITKDFFQSYCGIDISCACYKGFRSGWADDLGIWKL
jgi:hypothetical protein